MAFSNGQIIIATLLCLVPSSLGQQPQPDLIRVRERAREVQSSMLGRSCTTAPLASCVKPEIAELRSLLRDYTVAKLNRSEGNTNALIDDLRTVDNIFAYEVMGKPDNWDGLAPFVFNQRLHAGELVITVNHFAAGALYAPPGVVIIQGFRKVGGRYVFGGENSDSLTDIMNYRQIQTLQTPRAQNQMVLFVCGQVAGLQGQYWRARILSFDGYEFQELWAPEDREAMTIKITGDEIEARFVGPKIPQFGHDRQDRIEEKLRLTVSGLVRTSLINFGEHGQPKN